MRHTGRAYAEFALVAVANVARLEPERSVGQDHRSVCKRKTVSGIVEREFAVVGYVVEFDRAAVRHHIQRRDRAVQSNRSMLYAETLEGCQTDERFVLRHMLLDFRLDLRGKFALVGGWGFGFALECRETRLRALLVHPQLGLRMYEPRAVEHYLPLRQPRVRQRSEFYFSHTYIRSRRAAFARLFGIILQPGLANSEYAVVVAVDIAGVKLHLSIGESHRSVVDRQVVGRVARAVSGHVRQVTERKQATVRRHIQRRTSAMQRKRSVANRQPLQLRPLEREDKRDTVLHLRRGRETEVGVLLVHPQLDARTVYLQRLDQRLLLKQHSVGQWSKFHSRHTYIHARDIVGKRLLGGVHKPRRTDSQYATRLEVYVARADTCPSVGHTHRGFRQREAVQRVVEGEYGVVGELLHLERTVLHIQIQRRAYAVQVHRCTVEQRALDDHLLKGQMPGFAHRVAHERRQASLRVILVHPQLDLGTNDAHAVHCQAFAVADGVEHVLYLHPLHTDFHALMLGAPAYRLGIMHQLHAADRHSTRNQADAYICAARLNIRQGSKELVHLPRSEPRERGTHSTRQHDQHG